MWRIAFDINKYNLDNVNSLRNLTVKERVKISS